MTQLIGSHNRRMALTWTWLSLVVAIAAAIVAALPGPLYRYGLISITDAFYMVMYGAWTGIAAVLAGIVGVVATILTRRFRMLGVAVLAIAIGLVTFIWPYTINRNAHIAPPIHSISTDTEHPPPFTALADVRRNSLNGLVYGGNPGGNLAGAELSALRGFFNRPAGRASPRRKMAMKACRSWGPDCLAAVQAAYYPAIRPLELPHVPPDAAYAAALEAARDMGWDIAAANGGNRHIEATATSFWFGFKADIAIDVGAATGGGSIVNIRSESRRGLTDLGANARRVHTFLDNVQQNLPEPRS
ncbi:MAG: DUF1499 domain-containing protein [Gammaproteobacteria bacterium]|nr:DUF1499 domain-containing protein [Gammaproteobacteria bacterium]